MSRMEVLLTDQLGGGTWRPVSFEYNMPGYPGVLPMGLWVCERAEG